MAHEGLMCKELKGMLLFWEASLWPGPSTPATLSHGMRFLRVRVLSGWQELNLLRRTAPIGWIGLLLCLSGCAGIPSYPSHLPALTLADKETERTPALAGCYADRGTAFSKDGKPLGQTSLTHLLYKQEARHRVGLTNSNTVVVLGPQNDVLEVQSWQGDTRLATRSWQKLTGKAITAINKVGGSPDRETYRWHKGFVMLFIDAEADVFFPFMVTSDESLQFRKAVDGSLIVFHRDAGALVFVFVPVWHRQDVWYRFPPVNPVGDSGTQGAVGDAQR
jgi:hypothetical protein